MTQSKRPAFPKIREAREALQRRALEITNLYIQNAKQAMKKGQHDVAQSSFEYLLDHMPKDKEGSVILGPSVDKAEGDGGSKGPVIQIGFKLGGVADTKALPEAVIDVTPTPSEVPEDSERG